MRFKIICVSRSESDSNVPKVTRNLHKVKKFDDNRLKRLEDSEFQPDVWYRNLIDIASNPNVTERYQSLVQLHQATLGFYLPAIQAITSEVAASPSSDGRPISIVVAHIMAWEEWQTQIFGDQNREERLQKQMKLQGYYDTDSGTAVDFKSVDDFNCYSAKRYAEKPWNKIRQKAVETALQLQYFFPPNPKPDWINFLEKTPEHNWKITPGTVLSVPSGWYLWMVSLEHEAVEHRKDFIKGK